MPAETLALLCPSPRGSALFSAAPRSERAAAARMAGGARKTKEIVTREYTVNLHKALHGVTFKKRAPRAIKAVRAPGPVCRLFRMLRGARALPTQRRALSSPTADPRATAARRGARRG